MELRNCRDWHYRNEYSSPGGVRRTWSTNLGTPFLEEQQICS